jgi:8-oxo-dGTP pyrophosphatase MutT (NUDIX family)
VSSRFEKIGSEPLFDGKFISVRADRFRHEDGGEVTREVIGHPGAVGVVVLDGDRLWFVRQPREAIGVPDLLEIPAGKLDVEGEDPAECARRELAEEIGKRADHWERLGEPFYTSAGFTDELIHLYLATGIHDVERPEVEEEERIDVETRPLAELDAILGEAQDAKTLIGLHRLRLRLHG